MLTLRRPVSSLITTQHPLLMMHNMMLSVMMAILLGHHAPQKQTAQHYIANRQEPGISMQEAVQAALMLPAALRISAVTQEGIETLQLATMQLLSNSASSIVQQEST